MIRARSLCRTVFCINKPKSSDLFYQNMDSQPFLFSQRFETEVVKAVWNKDEEQWIMTVRNNGKETVEKVGETLI